MGRDRSNLHQRACRRRTWTHPLVIFMLVKRVEVTALHELHKVAHEASLASLNFGRTQLRHIIVIFIDTIGREELVVFLQLIECFVSNGRCRQATQRSA